MELTIRRGRLLREVLKQERFTPEPVKFQLAWLIAFNDGLLDDITTDDIHPLLARLGEAVARTTLGLESPRTDWRTALDGWLATPAQEQTP